MTNDDQIKNALGWIAHVNTCPNAEEQSERDDLQALATDYERWGEEIAELKVALTGDGSVRAEMYQKVYDKQAAEIARLEPLKVEDLQREIERLKAENAELRLENEQLTARNKKLEWTQVLDAAVKP